MAPSYPKVAADFERIAYAYGEERAFDVTLGQGNTVLDRELGRAERRLPGAIAFHLHDTYGFPVDLAVSPSRSPPSAGWRWMSTASDGS